MYATLPTPWAVLSLCSFFPLFLFCRFSNVSALKTSAELLSEEFYGFGGRGGYTSPSAGIGVTPTSDLLYFPWLFTVYDDTKKAGPDRQATLQPNPSLITLTPAPGEVFDLNFTLIGQFLEPSEVTAYLQVSGNGQVSQVLGVVHKLHVMPRWRRAIMTWESVCCWSTTDLCILTIVVSIFHQTIH